MHQRQDFLQTIDTMLSAEKSDGVLALLIVKLRRLRSINTAYSIKTADALLCRAEKRLRNILRPTDEMARVGDSEYYLLLPSLRNSAHAVLAANKIIDEFKRPFMFDDYFIEPKLVIGISVATGHEVSHEQLIRHSTMALIEAESRGEDYYFHEPTQADDLPPDLVLENEMHYAFEHDEFSLYFQPKINLKTRRAYGAEALIRWSSSKYGMVNTQYFVDVLENSTLLMPVTKWVVNTALRRCIVYKDIIDDFTIAVNLSPALLVNDDIVGAVVSALNIWDVDPARLVLEVTEGAMMKNPELSLEILKKINAAGVGISIDDFGTGYSSLSYLKHLPVDEIKIDKSFVMNMLNDPKDKSIVKSAIDLAHNLGLSVVAEGVENEEVLNALTNMKCDHAQGFYMARPMDDEKIMQWLAESSWVRELKK